MDTTDYLGLYFAPLALLIAYHVLRRHRRTKEQVQTLEEAQKVGLNEPPSLHPVVDPTRCFGSGACVRACPEGALGVVNGKATLINGSACIGHGACVTACPTQALTLVFGTERRGIDIPNVTEEFETNIPGIFIAGELGGMGLIRKTAEQGRQAMAAIGKRVAKAPKAAHDVIIVGAGPAGISAGLSAIHHQLAYKIIEQEDSLGGSVYHYPRNKIAMTAPVKLDVIGTMKLGTEVQKERLLEFWNEVVTKTGMQFNFNERLIGIERQEDGTFQVETTKAKYHTRTVLLALGRRGSPRKLEVPGEEQAKVVYRLVDATQYEGRHMLVVGGGDSALEAAIALAEVPGTVVSLSYRSEAFSRVKAKNRTRYDQLVREGRIQSLLASRVLRIDCEDVLLQTPEGERSLRNDCVIVCAGGVLPTPLLQSIGIRFETKFGTA